MIFSKPVNRILGIITTFCIIVLLLMAVDINRRFPNAKEISNDDSDSVMWKGCRIRALKKEVCSLEEYMQIHPDDEEYSFMAEDNMYGVGIVTYYVEVINENDYTVRFRLDTAASAAAFPSGWHNGIGSKEGGVELLPGEKKMMEATSLYAPSLVHFTELDTIEENEFQLIFSFYPERVVLKFR